MDNTNKIDTTNMKFAVIYFNPTTHNTTIELYDHEEGGKAILSAAAHKTNCPYTKSLINEDDTTFKLAILNTLVEYYLLFS